MFEIDSEDEGKVTNNHSSIIYNFRFDQFQGRPSLGPSVVGVGYIDDSRKALLLLLQIRLPAFILVLGVRYRATQFRSHICRTKGSEDGGESNSYRPLPLFFHCSATCVQLLKGVSAIFHRI